MNKEKLSAIKRQLECCLTSSIRTYSVCRPRDKRFQCKMVREGKAYISQQKDSSYTGIFIFFICCYILALHKSHSVQKEIAVTMKFELRLKSNWELCKVITKLCEKLDNWLQSSSPNWSRDAIPGVDILRTSFSLKLKVLAVFFSIIW